MSEEIQKERLNAYLEAEKKALLSQEYQEGSKKNRRADLNDIGAGINNMLAAGIGNDPSEVGKRSRRVIFRD